MMWEKILGSRVSNGLIAFALFSSSLTGADPGSEKKLVKLSPLQVEQISQEFPPYDRLGIEFSLESSTQYYLARRYTKEWDRLTKYFPGYRGQKQNSVWNISSLQNDNWIAAGTPDGRVIVWSAEEGKLVRFYKNHKSWVSSISFSPSRNALLTSSNDHRVVLQDLKSNKKWTLKFHTAPVNAAVFSPHGDLIATGSDDCVGIIWDSRTRKILNTLRGHVGPINSVAFSPNGDQVITASADGTAILWNLENQSHQVIPFRSEVNSALFSPDGKQVITASNDSSINVWTIKTKKLLVLSGHQSRVHGVVFSPSGKKMVSVDYGGTAILWDTEKWQAIKVLLHKDNVMSVAFSPEEEVLITYSYDRISYLWDLEN